MKARILFYVIPVFLLAGPIACFHSKRLKAVEREYGKMLPIRIKVFDYVNHFTDSCRKNGIDTLLVFSSYYSGVRSYPPVDYSGLSKKYASGKYEPESFSEPSYIFWIKNGQYFIKKVDQFSQFKLVKRAFFQDFQLYDFYFRNDSLLRQESELAGYSYQSFSDHFYMKTFAPNTIYIGIYCDSLTFSRTLSKYKYQPLVQTNDSIAGQKSIGNDQLNYYHNQQLKVYQWITLVQAELFDIEARQLWIRE